MFPKPRPIDSEPALYDAAIKILMRRAHSVHEMKKALLRRTPDEDLVKSVLDRLKRENLIDDARYAKQFTRHRAEIRRQGKFRIARDLRARGVPDRHIQSALDESADEAAERDALRHRIQRKLKLVTPRGGSAASLDQRKIASVYRSLLAAGFPADAIRRELKSLTSAGLPEPDQE